MIDRQIGREEGKREEKGKRRETETESMKLFWDSS